jgi:hypothetical protein
MGTASSIKPWGLYIHRNGEYEENYILDPALTREQQIQQAVDIDRYNKTKVLLGAFFGIAVMFTVVGYLTEIGGLLITGGASFVLGVIAALLIIGDQLLPLRHVKVPEEDILYLEMFKTLYSTTLDDVDRESLKSIHQTAWLAYSSPKVLKDSHWRDELTALSRKYSR